MNKHACMFALVPLPLPHLQIPDVRCRSFQEGSKVGLLLPRLYVTADATSKIGEEGGGDDGVQASKLDSGRHRRGRNGRGRGGVGGRDWK